MAGPALPVPDGGSGTDGSTGACGVANSAQDCGTCGNACPGLGLANAIASCADPATSKCDLVCQGDNFDIDKDPKNGCERFRMSPPGHTMDTAGDRGSKSCKDGESADSFFADLLSDARRHTGFAGSVGAAPDFWKVFGTGGACINDYDVTIQTTGGNPTDLCYQLTIITNKKTDSAKLTGAGSANLASGVGSYESNTMLYFKIEKICNFNLPEAVKYTVSYHL